jgi:hypothetical protein
MQGVDLQDKVVQVRQQEEDYGWGRIGKKRKAVQWYGSHAL